MYLHNKAKRLYPLGNRCRLAIDYIDMPISAHSILDQLHVCQMRQYLNCSSYSNRSVGMDLFRNCLKLLYLVIHFFVPIVIETTLVLHRTWSLPLCLNRGTEDTLHIPAASMGLLLRALFLCVCCLLLYLIHAVRINFFF